MFSYYLQDRSYYFATDKEVIVHLEELNNIIVASDGNDHFYRYKHFNNQCYNRRCNIGQFFQNSLPKFFTQRVLPLIQKRVKDINVPYMSLHDMNVDLKKTANAFMGPKFSVTSLALITNKSDYYDFRVNFITNNVSGGNFMRCCEILFCKVRVMNDVATKIKNLGAEARRIFERLTELDRYLSLYWKGDFDEYDVAQKTSLTITDESDTTKRTPKFRDKRYFNIPGVGGVYCFLHIKTGNGMRYHIYPDEAKRIVYIPYIGPHLPTKKNP